MRLTTAVLLIAAATPLQAQHPDLSGRWTFNAAESDHLRNMLQWLDSTVDVPPLGRSAGWFPLRGRGVGLRCFRGRGCFVCGGARVGVGVGSGGGGVLTS